MKTIALTTALIAAISAPAFAGSQLEKQLGVEHGVYTVGQLIELSTADAETGNEGRVYFGNDSGITLSSQSTNDRAAEIHAQLISESDGNEGRPYDVHSIAISSKNGVNARAAAIFAQFDQLSDGGNS